MASINKLSSSILLLFVAFVIHHQISDAYHFNVGGRAGWVVNPPEPYNTWAGRMRFQVNDTLLFRYNRGSNSVLEVNGNDYSQCNINSPITKMEDGNSIFTFNRTGPFYFISGNKTFCDQGQKLIVVVLALRNGPPPAPVAPVPAPAISPATSPAPAPGTVTPPAAPVPAPAISPAKSPAPAPGTVTPPVAPAPGSSGTNSPPTTPSSGGGSPPGTPSTPGSVTPPGTPSTPGSVNPPAGGNSSEASFTATSALMSAVTIILCLCMT